MESRTKLTKLERAWVLYDVANSAFTLLVATFFPIYFNAIAESAGIGSVDYLVYWGYASSIATVIVAFLGPIFGTMADTKGYKKPLFMSFVLIGISGTVALALTRNWLVFLVFFVLAKVGYASGNIFYDSMLVDVTTKERMDDISAKGYAWGYIGSCLPFVVGIVIVLQAENLGIGSLTAMSVAFFIGIVWWLVMTMPLLKRYKQTYYVEKQSKVVRESFGRLIHTLKNVKQEKKVFLFLLAFFCYIDGVYTIIDMATAYGTALGLGSTDLLLALLLTQIVAFPAALLCAKLSKKVSVGKLITICIVCYTAIAGYAIFLDTQLDFWILAFCVGLFQGGIQALSRSYFTKIIPPEKAGEYFGLYDICGKGAVFLGTMLVSVTSQITGSVNRGIGTLVILFLMGLILFRKADRMESNV